MKKIALDIGEVARASGLSPATLRFYEEKSLIRSTARNGLRRIFPAEVLEQLDFVALGKNAGFSLEELSAMFAADGRYKIDRGLLKTKAAELDTHIRQLIAIRDGLKHAAECKAPSHRECPKFQRLLKVAAKKRAKSRN